MRKGQIGVGMGFLIVLAIVVIAMVGVFMYRTQSIIKTPSAPTTPETGRPLVDCGKSATLYMDAYDKEADSLTEVSPSYYIFGDDGTLLVNGATADSVSVATCDKVKIYGKDDSNYYTDPKDVSVDTEAPRVKLDSHTTAVETSLEVTGYDDTGATELTADDNSNNTADYSMILGANEKTIFYAKLENRDDNSLFKLKAVCIGWNNDIDEVKLLNDGWTEVGMPKQIRDASVTFTNDTSGTFTTDYDTCYVYKKGTTETLDLHEYDSFKGKFEVTASSTDPTANTGDVFYVQFIDGGYHLDASGNIVFDFYTHDDNEQVTTIGVSEPITSPMGLTSGMLVEAQ